MRPPDSLVPYQHRRNIVGGIASPRVQKEAYTESRVEEGRRRVDLVILIRLVVIFYEDVPGVLITDKKRVLRRGMRCSSSATLYGFVCAWFYALRANEGLGLAEKVIESRECLPDNAVRACCTVPLES